jgi:dipeptidyl aminopeptidase/acylaminoacyl peptidase
MYSALKGLGKETRLVMLPLESHSYQARESVLHMCWEMDAWLARHLV